MFKIQKFYKKICTLFVVFCVAGQLWAEEEAVKQDFTENLELKAASAKSKFLALLHGFAPATLIKTPSRPEHIGCALVPAKNPDLDRIPGCGPVEDFKLDDTVMAKSKRGNGPRNAKPKKNSEKPQGDKAPEVGNMEDLVKNTPLGENLSGALEKIQGVIAYNGSPVYRITKDIEKLGLKKGDCFYLDKQHRNEIEVFEGCEHNISLQKLVISTSGEINLEKTRKAVHKEHRKFKRKGG